MCLRQNDSKAQVAYVACLQRDSLRIFLSTVHPVRDWRLDVCQNCRAYFNMNT